MEKSVYDMMDEIMKINHQITSYMIDFCKAELKGAKPKKIERNKIFQTLFERLQINYRELQEKLTYKPEEEKDEYNDDEEENMIMILDEYMESSMSSVGITELENYLESIYAEFHYVDIVDRNGNIIEESIYGEDEFKYLRQTEFDMQMYALIDINDRMLVNPEKEYLSYDEKLLVLTDLSIKKFNKEYRIKEINQRIKQLEDAGSNMDEEEYEIKRRRLYEEKYISYYAYLNNMYNGFLQENDKGKLALVKKGIDLDFTELILEMPKSEIDKIIKLNIEKSKKGFEENIDGVLKEREEGFEENIDEMSKGKAKNLKDKICKMSGKKGDTEEER